ncbi:MAG: hypothetical protein RL199_1509, partial [Pseudomonadota bacterium]
MSPAGRRALPAAAACFGLVLLLARLFHPGMLSRDSVEQLAQAVSGELDDWHPPLMAAVWGLLLRLPGFSKPQAAPLLFLLHLAAYGGAWALAARALARRSTRGWVPWLAPLLALSPACLTYTVNVWKDVGLAVAWLLAAMLLLEVREARPRPLGRRMAAGATLLLLLYGLGVRRNAVFGLPPLALLWWATFVPARRGRLAGAVLLSVGLVGGSAALERFVLTPAPARQAQLYLLSELTAMRCSGDGDPAVVFPDAVWKAGADLDRLCRVTWGRIHRHHNADHTVYGDEAPFVVAKEEHVTGDLLRALLDAIRRHPRTWAAHRIHMFGGLLDGRVVVLFHGVRENVLGLDFVPSAGTRLVSGYIAAFERTWLFAGWFWGLLAALGLWVTRRQVFGAAQAAFASGLCYLAGYL